MVVPVVVVSAVVVVAVTMVLNVEAGSSEEKALAGDGVAKGVVAGVDG